jgi:hypothetical protein
MTRPRRPVPTEAKTGGGRWRPGESGNPAGRPRGSRNRTTVAIEALLEGEAEALTRRAVARALEGDTAALRLCLDRISPVMRDRPVEVDLPALGTPGDLPAALSALLGAVARGELTPSEGERISRLLDTYVRALEASDLARRLEAIEAELLEGRGREDR